MSSEKITIAVAILGLIGTLGGTLGGIFVTNHLSRDEVFERRQTEQAVKAYSDALHQVFNENVYLPVVLYGDPEVVRRFADLEEAAEGGLVNAGQHKEPIMKVLQAMRMHVTGSGAVSDDTKKNIERLLF